MKDRGKVLPSIVAAFFVLSILATAALAVPKTINYQGRLSDFEGVPVNGTVSMTFAIYNAPTDGELLWSETQPSVTVTDGAFSVALGSVTPFAITFDEDYYLGVTVGGDAEMTPRAALVSVPYALRAKESDTAGYAAMAGAADTATTADSANTANILGDKTLSELVALLDSRYGNIGDSLVADFSATPLTVGFDCPVSFTDLSQGVPQSWLWDFGDSNTSTLRNPSHKYTSTGKYTVFLTVGDGVTSRTFGKAHYITVTPITTVDSTGNVGYYTSTAIGADGLPVISHYGGALGLKVAKCGNAYCSTGNTITAVDSAGSVGTYTSIAVGADGLPVISYWNWTNQDLKVAKCGNASCSSGNTTTPVDSAGDIGNFTSIAIGADGLPVISYANYNGTTLQYEALKVAKCGIANCTSGNTITTVDSAGDVGSYPSIAIGGDGLPVISYYGGTADLMVAHCGDASCSTGNTITTVDSAGDVGYYTSIAIGTDGLPVISYLDWTNGDLKVARCGDAYCTPATNTITTVDSAGSVGTFTSIAIGADGVPVISYMDSTNLDLKVAHCGNASCSSGNTITTVDSTGDTGRYTSIAIGTDNFPVISYMDFSNKNLKVAKCEDFACTVWP
jgi:PKD repeat protein